MTKYQYKKCPKEAKEVDNQYCQLCNCFDDLIVNLKQKATIGNFIYSKLCVGCIRFHKIQVGKYLREVFNLNY